MLWVRSEWFKAGVEGGRKVNASRESHLAWEGKGAVNARGEARAV